MPSRTIYLRPSSAASWWRCAGYAALNASLDAPADPDADNDVREDGTAAHWLAFEIWNGRNPALGSMSPNKRELIEEMFAGVEEYLDLLRGWKEVTLEQTLPVSSVFDGVQDGTPDAYSTYDTVLRVADFKFGFRPVEVWRHAQLIVYAWTLLQLLPHINDVELTIVQPRCPHKHGTVRTWATSRDELRPLAESLQAAARAAMAENPLCVPGSWCRSCGASAACRTLQAAGGAGVDASYDAQPHAMSPTQLGYELTKLQTAAQHIEHRIIGLSAQAESIIRHGQSVPGFELSRAATRYRWPEENQGKIATLGKLFGVDVHAPSKLMSPAKLRASFPGLDVQSMYAERPTGELRLKATDPNEAIKAFSKRK